MSIINDPQKSRAAVPPPSIHRRFSLSFAGMSIINDPQKIDRLLTRHVVEAIGGDALREKLLAGRPLRIKFGADPSRPDLHLGHAVGLRKLRAFQELGHTVIFLIGDYTAMIGDPSGKSKTRPALSEAEVKANAQTYFDQAAKLLDVSKVEVRFNSEWLARLSFLDVLRLTAKFTVARMIERDDFDKRLKEGTDVHLHELLYPVMQAYDSVALKADVEIGGTDQSFNILAGRELQKKLGEPEQACLFVGPLLVGTDGERKMSKSLDNYIGLTMDADEMFGRTMSVPDEAMWGWFDLATEVPAEEVAAIREACVTGAMNPRDAKVRLAKEIVVAYHGAVAAEAAAENFVALFQKKEVPDEMPEVAVAPGTTVIDAMLKAGLVATKGEARRLIEGKGVRLGGAVVEDVGAEVAFAAADVVLQKGKRHFVRLLRTIE
jgi:tyrosyl-tRNA synthetase